MTDHDHIEVRGVVVFECAPATPADLRRRPTCDASLTGRHPRARVSARASASPR